MWYTYIFPKETLRGSTLCNLEHMIEFSQRQTIKCIEISYSNVILRLFAIWVYNDVCNSECGLELCNKAITYLHSYLQTYIEYQLQLQTSCHSQEIFRVN